MKNLLIAISLTTIFFACEKKENYPGVPDFFIHVLEPIPDVLGDFPENMGTTNYKIGDTVRVKFTFNTARKIKVVDVNVQRIYVQSLNGVLEDVLDVYFESFFPNTSRPIIEVKYIIPDTLSATQDLAIQGDKIVGREDRIILEVLFEGNHKRQAFLGAPKYEE